MPEFAPYKALNDALVPREAELLSDKDGIRVFRVPHLGSTAVLKLFDDPRHLREIENYRLLQEIGVPTLRVYEYFTSALLMQDLASSPDLRLASEADLNDPETLKALASWYMALHQNGADAAQDPARKWYSEHALIQRETLTWIARETQTTEWPIWERLHRYWPEIQAFEASLNHTLTYNDFWWVNLAVGRDKPAALVFDYNFLGRGLATTDLRNVLAGLPEAGKAVFTAAYGSVDPREALVDDLFSPLVSLSIGLRRKERPGWLDEVWEAVQNGSLEKALEPLLRKMEEEDAPL